MKKSLIVTYVLWFFGGVFGLHHFYLGRDRHAFVWWMTAGGFILGWVRDLWKIPGYVTNVNEINETTENLINEQKKPPFSSLRFFGEVIIGCIFGYLILNCLPEELTETSTWKYISWILCPLAVTIGVHLVGNIGDQSGKFLWPLIGTLLATPFIIILKYLAVGYMAIFSALFFNWKAKTWKYNKRNHRFSLCKRLSILATGGILYMSLGISMFYHNVTITYHDGMQMVEVKLREAIENFFKSPTWMQIKHHFAEIKNFTREKGWQELLNECLKAFDPAGKYNALQVLELEDNATEEEITAKYRKLVKKWHPDKHKDEASKLKAQEKFIEIKKAYETLIKQSNKAKTEL